MKKTLIFISLIFLLGCKESEISTLQRSLAASSHQDDDSKSDDKSDDLDSKSDDDVDDTDESDVTEPEPELSNHEVIPTSVIAVKPRMFRGYTSIVAKDFILIIKQKDFCADIALHALLNNSGFLFKTTERPRIKSGFVQEIFDFRKRAGKRFYSCELN